MAIINLAIIVGCGLLFLIPRNYFVAFMERLGG
jgi:hypothetical protein